MKRIEISSGSPFEESIGFSRAVRVGRHVSLGGTAPLDDQGHTVGLGDPAAQARRCYTLIQIALESAGAQLRHVVRTRTMLTRISDWQVVGSVRREFLGDSRPVETLVQVSSFIDPEWLVEIEVDAIIDDEAPTPPPCTP